DNSYARELDGFYVAWQGEPVPAPQVLRLNEDLAKSLGFDPESLSGSQGAEMLVGMTVPDTASPLAMAYAGHQFGGFSPQLGDGRALLIGELIDTRGNRQDIHLKGSGMTPFSRGGDGKAALGPVLREYLIGEAMHALHIPTTRALAALTTGERIQREVPLPGAVLARAAASHIRVGTFQFFAARRDVPKLKQLADYAINRHYPHLANEDDKYVQFFNAVRDAQASLIANWMLVGFVHGVMNTDNMTISGETIDYGPCAFMDQYDPATVFSSIDHQGRYAFGRQPSIGAWNLARLAECLLPLIAPEDSEAGVETLNAALSDFGPEYERCWLNGFRRKLGLSLKVEGDADLANALLDQLKLQSVDYTGFFRRLAKYVNSGAQAALHPVVDAPEKLDDWLQRYDKRLAEEALDRAEISEAMNKVNPIYIPRNHKVEEALVASHDGDMSLFDKLLDVLETPFEERSGCEDYAKPAPSETPAYVTYCGT
ncbi:MAG: YdiU family protein, partial [Rhodobacteraceae bacterium]|nr:YdiU family protein [Paracoccaceae bacterium]